MKRLIILMAMVVLTGCASTRQKWLVHNHEAELDEVKFTLSKYVDEKTLEVKCQYNMDIGIPNTIPVTEKEMVQLVLSLQSRSIVNLQQHYKSRFAIDLTEEQILKSNLLPDPNQTIGLYDDATKTVYYLKGDWTTLGHEYLHYLNANASYQNPLSGAISGSVPRECLDEVSADLLTSILRKEEEIRRLKDENQRLRSSPHR